MKEIRESEFHADFRAQHSEFRNGCVISISHKPFIFMHSCDDIMVRIVVMVRLQAGALFLVGFDVLLDAMDSTLGFGSSSRHHFLDSVLL